MELNELKAKAYDLLASIEQARAMLNQVNQQIAEAQVKAKDKPKETSKTEETKE